MFPARLGVQHPQDRPGLRRLPAVPVRPTLGLQEAGLGVGAEEGLLGDGRFLVDTALMIKRPSKRPTPRWSLVTDLGCCSPCGRKESDTTEQLN